MNAIEVKCPTRVDLAGGSLDLWPISSILEGCITINLAIDIFTSCKISALEEESLELIAPDISFHKKIRDLNSYFSEDENKKDFLYPFLKYYRPFSCKISFFSQSPIGGGLGGSSSLSISLMTALSGFSSHSQKEPKEIVDLAHNLEAFHLNTPTGIQDYYPPILGGALALHHEWDGCKYEKLDFAFDKMAEKFLLVYTGSPHHSGLNNWALLKDFLDGSDKIKKNLEALRDLTQDLYHGIQKKDWSILPHIFQKEYEIRSKLSPTFSSDRIEFLRSIALKNGAEAAKICGAGGGGCVFLWAEKEHHEKLREVLTKEGFQVLNAKPYQKGREVIGL